MADSSFPAIDQVAVGRVTHPCGELQEMILSLQVGSAPPMTAQQAKSEAQECQNSAVLPFPGLPWPHLKARGVLSLESLAVPVSFHWIWLDSFHTLGPSTMQGLIFTMAAAASAAYRVPKSPTLDDAA